MNTKAAVYGYISVIVLALASSAAIAKDNVGMTGPLDVDIIFPVPARSVAHQNDGHLVICVEKDGDAVASCEAKRIRQLKAGEYFKKYFSAAPNIRIVGIGYLPNGYGHPELHIFYLRRN